MPTPTARFQRDAYQLRSSTRAVLPSAHAADPVTPVHTRPAQSNDARRDGFAKRVANLAAQGSASEDILLHAVADLEAFCSLEDNDTGEGDLVADTDTDVQYVDE